MTILEEIVEVKKNEIKKLREKFSFNSFNDFEFFNKTKMSFTKSLDSINGLGIIAEIKKASPSKGMIRENFNHMNIAEAYMNAGVNAISVLTDEMFFKGNINYLYEIAKIKEVPLLRKDFIIDEFQILEAKANGADLILLICECLTKSQIDELSSAAYEFGLEVLLELHSEDQIDKINFVNNKLIGVNNRDLKTFKVDLDTTLRIRDLLPEEINLISESGFNKREDVHHVKNISNGLLIGEHFMKSANIKDSVLQMKEWCLK